MEWTNARRPVLRPWIRSAEVRGGGGGGGGLDVVMRMGTQQQQRFLWTDVWRPVPRPWIRSAEVRGKRRYEHGIQQERCNPYVPQSQLANIVVRMETKRLNSNLFVMRTETTTAMVLFLPVADTYSYISRNGCFVQSAP